MSWDSSDFTAFFTALLGIWVLAWAVFFSSDLLFFLIDDFNDFFEIFFKFFFEVGSIDFFFRVHD